MTNATLEFRSDQGESDPTADTDGKACHTITFPAEKITYKEYFRWPAFKGTEIENGQLFPKSSRHIPQAMLIEEVSQKVLRAYKFAKGTTFNGSTTADAKAEYPLRILSVVLAEGRPYRSSSSRIRAAVVHLEMYGSEALHFPRPKRVESCGLGVPGYPSKSLEHKTTSQTQSQRINNQEQEEGPRRSEASRIGAPLSNTDTDRMKLLVESKPILDDCLANTNVVIPAIQPCDHTIKLLSLRLAADGLYVSASEGIAKSPFDQHFWSVV
ncbi:hypothetical protein VTP01DRAFT_1744 [Rhizomucor pusillus]|uniref:uncharacterized protein n=1 Tax=Rhizomucor pusillus TaxID=4840 RepID=UPI0037428D33